MTEGALHHQTWDAKSGVWSQKRSPPQPNIDLWISDRTDDFCLHGHTLRVETKHLAVTGMADTGCQSCHAGLSHLTDLRLSPADLIPVNLQMRSASGTNLPILGAALLRIKIQALKRDRWYISRPSRVKQPGHLHRPGTDPTGFPSEHAHATLE